MDNSVAEKIREFNRFYMAKMRLLGNHYLGSNYSATEVRIFYELYNNEGCNASYIAKKLNIDKSQLSKILANYQNSGYLNRISSNDDKRSYHLYLTQSGKELTEQLANKANDEINLVINHLTNSEKNKLLQSLDKVINLLTKEE